MSINELIEEALDLPVDERRLLADVIESSLPAPDPKIEQVWIDESMRRLEAYRRGEAKSIPFEEIFGR